VRVLQGPIGERKNVEDGGGSSLAVAVKDDGCSTRSLHPVRSVL
jgi:hypothetical protein